MNRFRNILYLNMIVCKALEGIALLYITALLLIYSQIPSHLYLNSPQFPMSR